ncbi:MAG: hypothetical protein P8Y42_00310 [Exilibacterium sp.]
MEKHTQRWFEQRERGNRFMLLLLAWLALSLGRGFTRVLLYPIVAYYLLSARKARVASRLFLRRALNCEPGWRDVFRHFYTFALVSLDRLYFLAGRSEKFDIEIEGAEVIDRCIAGQRGCLLLVSHMGSFDVMRVSGVRKRRLPIRILMDRAHNSRAMQLMESLDPQLATAVLDTGTAPASLALTLHECLGRGDLIGIMADRAAPGERVVHSRFLGAGTALPAGPWLLAITLKVPVILCVGLYTGGNRYRVYFESLSGAPGKPGQSELEAMGILDMGVLKVPRKERERALVKLVEHYASRLEHYARLAPYNWFNFYNFWADETATDH